MVPFYFTNNFFKVKITFNVVIISNISILYLFYLLWKARNNNYIKNKRLFKLPVVTLVLKGARSRYFRQFQY